MIGESWLSQGPKFRLPEEVGLQQLIDQLAADYVIRAEAFETESFTIYDTFDWRLFNKSLVLFRVGDRLCLRRLDDDEIILSLETKDQPVFVWDLPNSDLKAQLTPIVEMRALLKLASIRTSSASYRLLNLDEKTVLWLTGEELWPSPERDGPALAAYVRVKPVRGYSKYAKQVIKRWQELRLVEADDIYFKALVSAGKTAGDYSTKLEFKLSPDMRAGEATKVILRFLLDLIKTNEPYVKQDIDTEFLHDFRVAVRRTRSLLSQVKGVFPEEISSRFRADFAYIGRLSNQLRDLDVYLLSENGCRQQLPEILRDDIEPLFELLRRKRSRALQDTIDGLNSTRYGQIIQNWAVFLNEPAHLSSLAPNAGRPVLELAQERIYKRYKRIIKSGKRILEHSEEDRLHALRIECKKLRYLIEFFSSLFPADEIDLLTKQLKKLQNNLGDFNDLSVQQAYLLSLAVELPAGNPLSPPTLLAIGSLIGTLDAAKQQTKADFAQTFIDFDSPANRKLFKTLFFRTQEGEPVVTTWGPYSSNKGGVNENPAAIKRTYQARWVEIQQEILNE
jgi:CHAD domain-containing protein